MGFYEDLRDGTVGPLLAEFGQSFTGTRLPGTTALYTKSFDSAAGKWKWTLIAEPHTVVYVDPGEVPEAITGKLVELRESDGWKPGTRVTEWSSAYISSALLKKGDKLTIAGKAVVVVDVLPLAPGGVVLFWEVYCLG